MKEVNTNWNEKTVNKKTRTMMRKNGVMTIMVVMMRRRTMVIIMRTAEIMTMRLMVIVRMMVDRFVESCPGNSDMDISQGDVVSTGTYEDLRSPNWEGDIEDEK